MVLIKSRLTMIRINDREGSIDGNASNREVEIHSPKEFEHRHTNLLWCINYHRLLDHCSLPMSVIVLYIIARFITWGWSLLKLGRSIWLLVIKLFLEMISHHHYGLIVFLLSSLFSCPSTPYMSLSPLFILFPSSSLNTFPYFTQQILPFISLDTKHHHSQIHHWFQVFFSSLHNFFSF